MSDNILERAKALCDDIDRDLRLGVILLDREKTSSGIIAELIAECERLENASASAKTRSIEKRNLFADMEKDRDKWRQKTIVARAKDAQGFASSDPVHRCPYIHLCYRCGDHDWDNCSAQDKFIEQAEKELASL